MGLKVIEQCNPCQGELEACSCHMILACRADKQTKRYDVSLQIRSRVLTDQALYLAVVFERI
jgi:hypothetical protein